MFVFPLHIHTAVTSTASNFGSGNRRLLQTIPSLLPLRLKILSTQVSSSFAHSRAICSVHVSNTDDRLVILEPRQRARACGDPDRRPRPADATGTMHGRLYRPSLQRVQAVLHVERSNIQTSLLHWRRLSSSFSASSSSPNVASQL